MMHPTPWKLVPIGSLTTGEKCTGMCIEDAKGQQIFSIRSSMRSSEWNGPIPLEQTKRDEELLILIVNAVNKYGGN